MSQFIIIIITILFFFFFLATHAACGSYQARDQTHACPSCNQRHSSDRVGSLSCQAMREFEFISLLFTAVVLQQLISSRVTEEIKMQMLAISFLILQPFSAKVSEFSLLVVFQKCQCKIASEQQRAVFLRKLTISTEAHCGLEEEGWVLNLALTL